MQRISLALSAILVASIAILGVHELWPSHARSAPPDRVFASYFGPDGQKSVSLADPVEKVRINTGVEQKPSSLPDPIFEQPVAITNPSNTSPDLPVRILVPAIKIDSNIQSVGLDDLGNMDVPDGKSTDVGWYENGTVPGETGSAVLDAHVFAAFKNLKYLKPGNSIFITMNSGRKLLFKVEGIRIYPYQSVPGDLLFSRADTPRLNLITCYGKLTADKTTYTERIVVYAKLSS